MSSSRVPGTADGWLDRFQRDDNWPHLYIIARNFWPEADEYAWWLTDFCHVLSRQRRPAVVFVPRLERRGPALIDFLGNTIVRHHSGTAPWSAFRYWRNVARDLSAIEAARRHQARSRTGVLIFESVANTTAAVRAAQRCQLGATVRVGQDWQLSPVKLKTIQQIASLAQANSGVAWVAANPELEQLANKRFDIQRWADCERQPTSLESGANEPARERVLKPWVEPISIEANVLHPGDPAAQRRMELAQTHAMLEVPPGGKLVVCLDTFQDFQPLVELVRSWGHLRKRTPMARLWLAGADLPRFAVQAERVWKTIVGLSLVNEVVIPGRFDTPVDLLQAADLVVSLSADLPHHARILTQAQGLQRKTLALHRQPEGLAIFSGPSSVEGLPGSAVRQLDAQSLAQLMGDCLNAGTTTETSSATESAELQLGFELTVGRYLETILQ